MKFCFLCGKETEKLIEGYCERCYNKEFQLIKVPEKIPFIICCKCNMIKHKNSWKELDTDDIIKENIEILGKNVKINIEKNDIAHVYVKGFLKNSKKQKEEVHNVILKQNKTVCPFCSRRHGNYYEAILQLRGNISEEILDFVDEQIILASKKDKKAFYRVENIKNGFDFYIGSKSLADKIADLLRKRFKAETKKSFHLVTRKEGKDIYRSVVLVRVQ